MHSAVIVMVPKAIVREAPEKWTLECHILTQIILSSLTFHFLCWLKGFQMLCFKIVWQKQNISKELVKLVLLPRLFYIQCQQMTGSSAL